MIDSIITDTKITFIGPAKNGKGNQQYQLSMEDSHAGELIKALESDDMQEALRLTSAEEQMKELSKGRAELLNGIVYYNSAPVHNSIQERIEQFFEKNIQYDPLLRLMENIYRNLSPRAITEVFPFLEAKCLPITPDGCFIGYKVVIYRDGHLWDKRTGKVRNDIGDKPYMDRGKTADWGIECGQGFHVGNLAYSGPHGWFFDHNENERIILVKVNPKDVVSVPEDESDKLRCNTYEVIGMYNHDLVDPVFGEVAQEEPKVSVADAIESVKKTAKKRHARKMRTVKYPETWKEYITRVMKEFGQPIYLGSLYTLVKRPGKNVHAKVRQVLQQVAKKNKDGNWILK
jgi:hypothetical protein